MTLRAMGVAIVTLFLAGPAFADSELHIYNWEKATNPKLIEKFEKTYNVRITLAEYDSNATALPRSGRVVPATTSSRPPTTP